MNKTFYKIIIILLLFFITEYAAVPVYAQETTMDTLYKPEQPFIYKGEILAGFSVSFSDASGRSHGFNYRIPNETTNTSIQLSGLYFVNDHFGVGPVLGYHFRHVDWSDFYTQEGQFKFGAQGGYYVPFSNVFNSSSNIYLFVSGGISWLRRKYPSTNGSGLNHEYDIGFRIGPGLLFPVGKKIAIQTALQFQTRRQRYSIIHSRTGIRSTTYKWPITVGLSVGLRVKF